MDERLVAPEAHAEIVDGRVYRTMGANEPHATEHTEVARVLRACLAPGYRVAVDMLTRATKTTDAAPDVSVFQVERDPVTGGRKIEEIAFEVADTESTSHATKRGVRRGVNSEADAKRCATCLATSEGCVMSRTLG